MLNPHSRVEKQRPQINFSRQNVSMKNIYILLCPHLQLKTESKSAPTTPSGHKNSSNRHHHHHHSSSHRDKDRSHHRSERSHHRSSDHHRRKRYNVGVQCKVGDKYKTSSSGSSSAACKSAGYSLANPCPSLEGSVKYKYGRFMRVETYPNGEGKVLHLWHDEISGLNEKEIEEVAKEFIEVSTYY